MHHSKDELFKIVTVIQDIGSGKTHLSLHLKTLQEVSDKAIISYIDLSQVHPREIDTVFSAIMKGFDDEYFKEIFSKFIDYLTCNLFPMS